MKYLQDFKESCVNVENAKCLILVMVVALFCTDSLIWTLGVGGIYIISLILAWELVKFLKRKDID